MKLLKFSLCFIFSLSVVQGNEDHLVLVPTPIIVVGNDSEHTVIEVPYVSGYGLDFLGYCKHIASPYKVDINSPSSKNEQIDINPLSKSGLTIDAREKLNGNVHVLTLDFSAVKDGSSHSELLRIATKCIYKFGDVCASSFKAEILLKGVPEDSILHAELLKIQAARKRMKPMKQKTSQ